MKNVSLAIIGAGVAGLTFAAQLSRLKNVNFTIFQKESKVGGRMNTVQIFQNGYADMGANIIDFQNEKQEVKIRKFLKSLNKQKQEDNLRLLKQPFLIYQHKLRKADFNKDRFYYDCGFLKLVQDLQKQIKEDNFQLNYCINKIKKINQKWLIIDKQNKQYNKFFDYIVLAMDGPADLALLKNSQLQFTKEVENNISQSSYTTQISLAYQLVGAPQFSCILFKDHPITFMSSHCEKYSQNTSKIVVIQLNHQISIQLFNQTQSHIYEAVRLMLPAQMEKWIRKPLAIKKWKPSLIKQKKTVQLMSFQRYNDGLFILGDISKGSSRVTGAMQTSLDLLETLKVILSQKV